MSIYATLWRLRFPEHGDDYHGCGWVEVLAQGVPAPIGSPTPGCGYEDGDPYSDFLPPPLETDADGHAEHLRAVVFVRAGTAKGTPEHGQEYTDPLLVITGEAYDRLSFAELHGRLCDRLRGERPRLVLQAFTPDGRVIRRYEDGSDVEDSLSGP